MRDGFAHDDIYIMVEDEFLSTARLFTSHLHHAEYVRLKNAAKARANTASISRPTDSITAMRAETKKKKEAEFRAGKNKAALDEMMGKARGGISHSDDSGNFDSDEEDADKTPWVGTSLQGLMAPDAKKNLTSLTGLQGIQSSTRAAKGLSKPEVERRRSNASLSKSAAPSSSSRHPTSPGLKRRLPSPSSSSASSDDLDAPPLPLPRKLKPQNPPSKPEPLPNPLSLAAQDLFNPPQHKPPPRSKMDRSTSSPPPPRKKKVLFHSSNLDLDLDADTGEMSPPRQSQAVLRRLKARRERAAAAAADEAKTIEERDGGGNVNEIPIFLV